MSFLNTPGTDGYNSVTREEAINLLLASIAQEEAGLSKLMDAERNKVLYTINRYRHGRCDLKNVLEINKSVDSTIKNMIKYQMLLQHKLENVKELLASFPEESKTAETAHAGAGAAKCSPKASSVHSTPRPAPEGFASPRPVSSCSARAGSAPKRPHQKCSEDPAVGRDCPGQKCSAKKGQGHPSQKCSAEKTPAAEKRCKSMPRVSARGPCNRIHDENGACRCMRKSAANRKAAMLRSLLFCFLPFGLL